MQAKRCHANAGCHSTVSICRNNGHIYQLSIVEKIRTKKSELLQTKVDEREKASVHSLLYTHTRCYIHSKRKSGNHIHTSSWNNEQQQVENTCQNRASKFCISSNGDNESVSVCTCYEQVARTLSQRWFLSVFLCQTVCVSMYGDIWLQ